MRRGEVWTASGGSAYTGTPRPVAIVQDDRFDAISSVTICNDLRPDHRPTDAPLFRPVVESSETNGLRIASRLMADKVTTMPRAKLGSRIGRLADRDVRSLDRALLVFLGLVA